MFINTGLIYSSLNYLTSNFGSVVSLSTCVYGTLRTTRFRRTDTLLKHYEDFDILDDLVELEPVTDGLLYCLSEDSLISKLSKDTFIRLLTNCEQEWMLNNVYSELCKDKQNIESIKLMLELRNNLIGYFDIDAGFRKACDRNQCHIAQLLINHGADITEGTIKGIHSRCTRNEKYDICKLLVKLICKSDWYKRQR